MTESKETPGGEEQGNQNLSWLKEQEEKKAKREERVDKTFSRIDKKIEKIKNRLDLEKKEDNSPEETKITWPEMTSLIEADEGNMAISNPYLIRMAKTLSKADENYLNYGNLSDYLHDGNKKFVAENIPKEEWTQISRLLINKMEEVANDESMIEKTLKDLRTSSKDTAKSTKKIEKIQVKSQEILKLPKKEEEQRKILIPMIENIEGNDLSLLEARNGEMIGKIASFLGQEHLNENLKRECVARLRLHHSAAIAEAIPPSFKPAKEYLIDKLGNPESQRWLLQGEDFDFLFKKTPKDLNIKEAFEFLETASTEGLKIKDENDNFVIKNLMDKDISVEQKEKILSYIKGQLEKIIRKDLKKENKKVDDVEIKKAAKKSLQLAQRLARATFESSAWNINQIGNDPLADVLYFRNFRSGKAKIVKDRGPRLTISRIDGFGAPFFRDVQTYDEKELFLNSENRKKISNDYNDESRINRILKRNRGREEGSEDFKQFLDISDMNFGKLNENAYLGWLMGKLPVYLDVKELLLKTAWKPDDFDSDTIESWIKPFALVDPRKDLDIKNEFIAGAFYSTFKDMGVAAQLGWHGINIKGVVTNLRKKYEFRGKTVSFLDDEDWNHISLYLKDFKINLYHRASMEGTVGLETKVLGIGR